MCRGLNFLLIHSRIVLSYDELYPLGRRAFMDKNISELIKKNIKLIDLIRMNQTIDRTTLAQIMEVTWPTISSYVTELNNSGILHKEGSLLSVNGPSNILFGISVGSAHIKITIVDMGLQLLPTQDFQALVRDNDLFAEQKAYMQEKGKPIEHYLYCKTPTEEHSLTKHINGIFDSIMKIVERNKEINVLSIGVAFTGSVDKKKKRILKSSNLPCLSNLNFEEGILLRNYLDFFETKGIHIALENNSVAAGIAEKWSLYSPTTIKEEHNVNNKYKERQNIVSIYLGVGFGIHIIQNNHVYHQRNLPSDGVGHLEVPDFSKKEIPDNDTACTCGENSCLDFRIRNDVFEMSFDEFRELTSEDIYNFFMTHPEKRTLMGEYVGHLINILTGLLNPDLIIITGKLHRGVDFLWEAIQQKRNQAYCNSYENNCLLIKSHLGSLAPAIGAAICGYYDRFEADIEW